MSGGLVEIGKQTGRTKVSPYRSRQTQKSRPEGNPVGEGQTRGVVD